MADKKGNIIIIKKKGGGHGGHHGGAWKVAYADFVTGMMAFFLVMWIVGLAPQEKEHIARYFNEPTAFATGIFEGGAGIMEVPKAPEQGPPAIVPEEQAQAVLARAGQEILETLMSQEEMGGMGDSIEVELTGEGLRINLMENSEGNFFDSGSSRVSEHGRTTLETIAKVIGPLGLPIAIEGHTDSKPFARGGDYTNWELSADRANSARRILESYGVPHNKISEVRGFADTQLRFPNEPEDPKNRRVSITVFRKSAMKAIEPQKPMPILPKVEGGNHGGGH